MPAYPYKGRKRLLTWKSFLLSMQAALDPQVKMDSLCSDSRLWRKAYRILQAITERSESDGHSLRHNSSSGRTLERSLPHGSSGKESNRSLPHELSGKESTTSLGQINEGDVPAGSNGPALNRDSTKSAVIDLLSTK